jgi:hypothetical protein
MQRTLAHLPSDAISACILLGKLFIAKVNQRYDLPEKIPAS